MDHWTEGQMLYYSAVQIITAVAYYVIPLAAFVLVQFSRKRSLDFILMSPADMVINGAFILACGTHHLAHAFLMNDPNKVIPMLAVDTAMAAISVIAAARAAFSIWGIVRFNVLRKLKRLR